jgi:hypothetical protein
VGFDDRLRQTFVIERPADGAVDDYNQPTTTYATLASVAGLMQPKRVEETTQLNQAGATVSTYTGWLRPTDLEPSDRIRIASGPMAGTYEIDGIRDAAGLGHHYEIDCRMVAV